jgi:hypothetical protein
MGKMGLRLPSTLDSDVAERSRCLGASIGSVLSSQKPRHKSLLKWKLLKLVPFRPDPIHRARSCAGTNGNMGYKLTDNIGYTFVRFWGRTGRIASPNPGG